MKNVSVCVCVLESVNLLVKPRGYDRRVEDFFEHLSQPLMPLHKFVRLLREAAKLIHAGQVLHRPRVCKRGVYDKEHLGLQCFFSSRV